MPKFGISIYSISRNIMSGEITPEQGVQWLCENGAEVIEIVPFGIDIVSQAGLAQRMAEQSARYGVNIDNYSLNADFLMLTEQQYAEEMKRVKLHMDAAQNLGIKTFRVDCAGFRRPMQYNTIGHFVQELPLMTRTYQQLCDYAAQYNLTVLLENHGFHVNGCDRVQMLLDGVGRDNFGHQLDVGNYICVDDVPEVATGVMIERAVVIHMKDFYVRRRDPGDASEFDCSGSWFKTRGGRYLRGSIFAQGDLDVYDILKTVKQSGFDGNIFIEYEGMEQCYYGTKVSIDNLKRIYNYV